MRRRIVPRMTNAFTRRRRALRRALYLALCAAGAAGVAALGARRTDAPRAADARDVGLPPRHSGDPAASLAADADTLREMLAEAAAARADAEAGEGDDVP
jgi:hypothetical protein